jgi:ribosomal protein S27AE
MTFSEYTLENSPNTGRPECPKCTTQIYLAGIEPEKPGFELRAYECPRCQHVKTTVVQF